MTPKAAPGGLDTEQFAELFELVKDSKSVELKLTIPQESTRAAVEALGLDPLDGQIRLVTFFDTPDLTLNKAGVVVRCRRIQGKGADSVVKLRPVVPDELPAKLRRLETFGIEVDAMPGGFVCSASFKGVADPAKTKQVSLGQAADPQDVQQGPARLLQGPRPGGSRARRPLRPRADLRGQSALRAARARPQARRRAVALPGRQPHLRALHEVHPARPASRSTPTCATT